MIRIIAMALAFALPVSAQAATIINGSFEDGVPFSDSFKTVDAVDSTSITGWTVASGSVDYIGSYWSAQNGGRSLDMSGNSAASIFQTFATTAGKTYRVNFWLGGNPAGAPADKSLTATVGLASNNFSFSTIGAPALPGMNWKKQTFTFLADNSGSSTLKFQSNTPGFFGPALDSVSVSAVPEPATWAMMICGFGLIGAALRRRRNEAAVAA